MAAFLYPGVKSLQLVLDTPYDAIRTTDVRDDLASVKVWYSTISGFNPNNGEGTLAPAGDSLSVIINGLTPNTRYYVKYAFVSAIDPDELDPAGPDGPGSYTVSAQLTAVVFDENVTVYGNLTRDPVPIVTKADGTGGDFTNATGVFRVFNLSQEVTGGMGLPAGTGPVYAIKANSLDSLTGVVINATTGVYSCTGLTDDGGNVTFTATYNNVVVEQTWNVYRAKAGETAPLLQLSTPNKEFLYKDQFATSSLTPSTTITARLINLTGDPGFTVQAFTRDGTPLGTIAFTQGTGADTNKITITKAQFDARGVTIGTAVVTATLGTVSDVITLYRINDGSEQITVELSNESHQIPAYQDGTVTSYEGSGTLIQVKEGNTYLTVDNTSPFENGTWTITNIDDVNIVCDTTPLVTFQGGNFIDFDAHSAMDEDKDVAYIDYTITGKTSTGKAFTIVKRQSLAKSKEGLKGATARAVSITAPSQIFVTAKNTTTVSPATIALTAVQSNFVNPTYTWLVDGVAPTEAIGTVAAVNGNVFTLKSFAAVGSKTVKVTVTETIDTVLYSEFDIFTVYSLREGDDSFIAGLSNENQTISCDSAGDPITGSFPVTSTLYAALGSTFLTASTTPAVTFAVVSYSGGTLPAACTIDAAGVVTINSLNANSATAVVSATINSGTANAKTITKNLTLNKSRDGASAISYWLTLSEGVLKKSKAGVISPASITVNAYYSKGNETPVAYAGRFKIYESGSATASYSSAVNESSKSYTLSSNSVTSLKVELYSATTTPFSTLIDEQSIPVLLDGSDTVTAILSNESVTLPAASDGTVSSFTGASTTMSVFIGATDDSANWTYARAYGAAGITSSDAATSRTQTVNSLTVLANYIDITASKTGYPSITKRFSVSKSKDGVKGDTGEGTTQIYIRSTDNPPATPGASAGTPSGWYDTVAGATGTDPLWTSFGKRAVNGTTYTWQAPVRVEGTQGISANPLKNATGYLYYGTASATAPTAPGPVAPATTMGYVFSTGEFTSLTSGWSTTFAPAPASTTLKMWAVRYSVQETVAGGAQTVTISSVFTHQNFNGLVTFTNETYVTPAGATTAANTAISNSTVIANKVDAAGATTAANTAISNSTVISGKANSSDVFVTNTTTIDGGKIYAGSIDVNRLSVGPFSAPGVTRTGERVVITQNKIEVYDSAGTRRVVLGDLS